MKFKRIELGVRLFCGLALISSQHFFCFPSVAERTGTAAAFTREAFSLRAGNYNESLGPSPSRRLRGDAAGKWRQITALSALAFTLAARTPPGIAQDGPLGKPVPKLPQTPPVFKQPFSVDSRPVIESAKVLPSAAQKALAAFCAQVDTLQLPAEELRTRLSTALEGLNRTLFPLGFAATYERMEWDSTARAVHIDLNSYHLYGLQAFVIDGMKASVYSGRMIGNRPYRAVNGFVVPGLENVVVIDQPKLDLDALTLAEVVKALTDYFNSDLSVDAIQRASRYVREQLNARGMPDGLPARTQIFRAFQDVPVEDIRAILRSTSSRHELLHLWRALKGAPDPEGALPENAEDEFQAYLGQLALTRRPGFQITLWASRLGEKSSQAPTLVDEIAKDQAVRSLARTLSTDMADAVGTKNQRWFSELSAKQGAITKDDVWGLLERSDKASISLAQVARRIYEKRFGALPKGLEEEFERDSTIAAEGSRFVEPKKNGSGLRQLTPAPLSPPTPNDRPLQSAA